MKLKHHKSKASAAEVARQWWARGLALALGVVLGSLPLLAALPTSSSLSSLHGSFQSPSRLASGAAARLFVSDTLNGKVVVLDAFGRESSVKTGLGQPLGIAVGADGKIYVGDAKSGAVSVFDAQWNLIQQLGQGGGEFQLPGYLALLTNNGITTVFVSDGLAHKVKAYRDGTLVGQYGSLGMGPQQFDFPAGIWIAPDRTVFVVDQNNDRIQVLNENGTFLRWFSLDPTPAVFGYSGRAQGIVGDDQGRLYVTDTFQGHVKVFDVSGRFLGFISGPGRSPGQLRAPGGIALDAFQRLWIADANNGCVDGFGLECFTHLALAPTSQTVAAGATVNFMVTTGCAAATGFQWFKDGVILSDGGIVNGATNGTLSVTNMTSSDAGAYSVVITTSSGEVISPAAQLSVVSAPSIFSSPISRTVNREATVTFSVAAQGGALSYQWLRNGAELAGATQSVLQISNVQSYEAGSYSARVSNIAGTATSSAAILTVLVPPAFTVAPLDQIVPAGSTVTLTANAVGTAPLSYLWYRNGLSLSGQTKTQLVISNATSAVNGTYLVRVANLAGAAVASCKFAVNSPMVLTSARSANGDLVFSWNNPFFVLQAAPDWIGPWQIVSLASPYTVGASAIATNSAQYFRLARP